MATRDKSQGFGFVYVDLKDLIAQRDELYQSPVSTPANAKVVNFNRDRGPLVPPPGVRQPTQERDTTASLTQIKENLDRLQALHHKLHAVLEELSTATDRERNKK